MLVGCGVCKPVVVLVPDGLSALFFPLFLDRTYSQPCAFSICCLQFDSRLDRYGQGLKWHSYKGGAAECLSLWCLSISFSVGQPYSWYLQFTSGHFHGREWVFSCFVRSQGRLNSLSHPGSRHRFGASSAAEADRFRRAIDRMIDSSSSAS